MIGNLTPFLPKQSQQMEAFMKPYCSLCSSLRGQYGIASSLLLNYELSFVLFSAGEYIQGTPIQTPCPSSGFLKQRAAWSHPAADAAAALSITLGWLKTIDFLADEKKNITFRMLVKKLHARLDKKTKNILEQIQPATREAITQYAQVSANSSEDMQVVREKTFNLSQQIANEILLYTTMPESLRYEYAHFFGTLGVSIAMLDPLLDVEKDLNKGSYNPIVDAFEKKGDELKDHYTQFLKEYTRWHEQVQQALQRIHFPTLFVQTMTSSLRHNYSKIKQVADKVFGGMEDKMLEAMIGCSKTCQTATGTRAAGLVGILLPMDSCGGGSGCGGGNNCGSGCNGCGNSCHGCGNSCNGCGNACNGCGNSCNSCGDSCNGCSNSC